MSMNKKRNILIITALPFKKQGNQSLLRFVKMLINNGYGVEMLSSENSGNTQNVLIHDSFILRKIFSFSNLYFKQKRVKLKNKKSPYTGYYEKIKSETVLPPYGDYSIKTMVVKWLLFMIALLDNFVLLVYILLFKHSYIKRFEGIIGYECFYSFASKIIAILFHKKYINKFQGTILKVSNRNLNLAIKFFPLRYFGIIKSDLCFMVNDGTDGEYYAKVRGCKNIYFNTHGVDDTEYLEQDNGEIEDIEKWKDKYIFFNNATASTWKRTDRIIRSMGLLDRNILNRIVLLTTYHADDIEELRSFTEKMGLNQEVIFLENLDHKKSNYLLRHSRALIMTNDMSNLGNPVLEAIYYKIPLISINDGSLDGFVINNKNAILIDLDSNFDSNLAKTITQMVSDETYYSNLLRGASLNNTSYSLKEQQEKEIRELNKVMYDKTV